MADLDDLGWNAARAEAFAEHRTRGYVPARVSLEHTHIYRVMAADGEWLAQVSGRLRHGADVRSDFPAVGDWVAVAAPADSGGGMARIHAVLPRASRFSRRAAGDRTEEQVVASNIDTVFLVAGLDGDFNPRRIERYLLVAQESGAQPVIVLNKADLADDPLQAVAEVVTLSGDVPVHAISCEDGRSVEVLRQHLGPGRTGALLGSSGVGKSTIVNRLVGYDLRTTKTVRVADSRGRHASTSRQLVLLDGEGGVLIDTPGMRELQLWDAGDGFAGSFEDIAALAGGCRFRDCRHEAEPGCAVRSAVERGALPDARLESFRKLQAEAAFQARQQDQRAQLDERRRTKVIMKSVRRHLKDKGH